MKFRCCAGASLTLLVLLISQNASGQQQLLQQAALINHKDQQQQQLLPQTNQLQAQLQAIQAQAQRQLSQLNSLMLQAANQNQNQNANQNTILNQVNSQTNNQTGSAQASSVKNVLETLSSMGKAIQQQLSSHVHIVTGPPVGQQSASSGFVEPANSKKNEYQSIVITDQGSSLQPASPQTSSSSAATNATTSTSVINYREQGEQLRQEIVRRVAQLQQVVASSMDLMKNNGDVIVRRLLEQMNTRLDMAKARAERIISEPTTNEMAIRALGTINLGLNNLNNIISNIVNRLELAAKEGATGSGSGATNQQRIASAAGVASGGPSIVVPLLDTNRIKHNLQQLGQQFQSALNNSQLHQHLLYHANANRQRQALAPINLTPQIGTANQNQVQTNNNNEQQQQNKINVDFVNQQQQRQ